MITMKKSIVASFMALGILLSSGIAFAQTADDYGMISSSNYCPKLSTTMQRGARDVSYSGQVSELQKFFSDYYEIDEDEIVTGFFGRVTLGYVIKFQKEHGLPSFGIVGSMTRATIAKVCTSSTFSGNSQSGIYQPTVPTLTITPATYTTPTITLISPNTGKHWYPGTAEAVTWSSTGIPSSAEVLVRLRSVSTGQEHNLVFVGNNGSVSVTVPTNVSLGHYYIEVKTSVNNVSYSDSSYQYIKIMSAAVPSLFPADCMTNPTNPACNTLYICNGIISHDPSCTSSASTAVTPAINSFLASPSKITAGQPVTLSWVSSLATKCGILRDAYTWVVMDLGTSGTYIVYPNTSTTYTLSCAGTADGSGKDAPGAHKNLFVLVQ